MAVEVGLVAMSVDSAQEKRLLGLIDNVRAAVVGKLEMIRQAMDMQTELLRKIEVNTRPVAVTAPPPVVPATKSAAQVPQFPKKR